MMSLFGYKQELRLGHDDDAWVVDDSAARAMIGNSRKNDRLTAVLVVDEE